MKALRGQAIAEYLLCVAGLCTALLLPFDGGDCAAARLALAIRGFFRGVSFLVSIS